MINRYVALTLLALVCFVGRAMACGEAPRAASACGGPPTLASCSEPSERPHLFGHLLGRWRANRAEHSVAVASACSGSPGCSGAPKGCSNGPQAAPPAPVSSAAVTPECACGPDCKCMSGGQCIGMQSAPPSPVR